ncbi:hypothetical protein P175DRAFT_0505361 [Aspergillus ochraceoroseus IBT 24754]|uniref:Uncharacterized protein n=1 Tax=Aspergillus ochraceoroseus IBT 24754 TaxID=1392256 RepID=A0A2T5LKZ9_9EURO|nr:uncharacterized protein P175DRAFT_0505361 [Aspergillus ochraceoroseus IBT 24754]PTU16953.1 hypothetical protein P175DRAFT_0505361 [Aspergillus ochraceoroseus IBT 24754]
MPVYPLIPRWSFVSAFSLGLQVYLPSILCWFFFLSLFTTLGSDFLNLQGCFAGT